MADNSVISRIGRVTGTVHPGAVGEVMIAIRGGSEAFNALPEGDETIPVGTRIVVIDYFPPRTVVVSRV